jgi:PIN domain nuclease of toxin-antitoxin system
VNLLLDTNALIWTLEDSDRLTGEPRAAITNPANTVYVSVASTWELAIKVALGRLALPANLAAWLPDALAAQRFTLLPVTLAHTLRVEALPRHHRDPFDRMLIAQAMIEGCWIVTSDQVFAQYGVPLILC